MTISVIVPTYRRPEDLRRCLAALAAQGRAADQVIVVARDTDEQTRALLKAPFAVCPSAETVIVSQNGVVAAMNAGLAAARGEVIALTDDDAVPRPDWLDRIERRFAADQRVGGVGGRDWLYHNGVLSDGRETNVGRLNWFGRGTGAHHLAVGDAREVDVLKGVNCAYRAEALRAIGFDSRLAGSGAQVHWELSLGLTLKRAGWKLLLDPQIAVDHYPARRFDEDQRNRFSPIAETNAITNETLAIMEHLRGARRIAFVIWAALIGTSPAPGVLQLPRLVMMGKSQVLSRWTATIRGRWRGMQICRQTRRHPRGRGLPASDSGNIGAEAKIQ